MRRVVLVSCCGEKLEAPASALELYRSRLFRLARAYAEQHGDAWLILSARHGAIAPDQVVAPYDLRLPTRRADRAAWGAIAAQQLADLVDGPAVLVSLAGAPYTDTIAPRLPARLVLEHPLAGLGIGDRLAWLKARVG